MLHTQKLTPFKIKVDFLLFVTSTVNKSVLFCRFIVMTVEDDKIFMQSAACCRFLHGCFLKTDFKELNPRVMVLFVSCMLSEMKTKIICITRASILRL